MFGLLLYLQRLRLSHFVSDTGQSLEWQCPIAQVSVRGSENEDTEMTFSRRCTGESSHPSPYTTYTVLLCEYSSTFHCSQPERFVDCAMATACYAGKRNAFAHDGIA
jgi:hypothetical protein